MPAPEQVTLQRVVDLADEDVRQFLEAEVRRGGMTPGEARTFLSSVLPAWAEPYESASATVAADLYDQRRMDAGASAVPYQSFLAPPATEARWAVLSSWATAPLLAAPVIEQIDWDAAFQRIVGGAHRTIADAHRNTTIGNSLVDPGSRGWRRVGRGGETCDFCLMLIGRGEVYDSISVQFKSHDNCRCGAESVFDNDFIRSDEFAEYGGSARKRKQTDADRARVREWLAFDKEADPDKYGLP